MDDDVALEMVGLLKDLITKMEENNELLQDVISELTGIASNIDAVAGNTDTIATNTEPKEE